MTSDHNPQLNVLGTEVAAVNLDQTVQQISGWLSDDRVGRYVSVVDVNCIMQSYRRREVRMAYRSADICVPDGMPLTWVGRVKGHAEMGRVYGPDLMLTLLELAAKKGYTNYFLGGREGVVEDLKTRMVKRFPGLKVVGTCRPPFRSLTTEEKAEMISAINRVEPDLLWIGLGAPKQDLFMAEYHEALSSRVMIGVGAAFDFHTGRVQQAPRWMMKAGLEWLFRLCVEPRRLGPRYLRNNPAFLFHIFLQLTGVRHYPPE